MAGRNTMEGHGMGWSGSGEGQVAVSFEHGSKPWVPVQSGDFLD
jgi:hypothetical protein